VIAALGAAPAAAADLATKAPQAAPPAPSWAGFYLGGSIGGGMAALPVNDRGCFDCVQAGLDFKPGGFVGGVYVGYNWQLSPLFLVGVETDFNWTSFKADETSCFQCVRSSSTFNLSSKLDHFGTVRARFGLTSGNVLAYVTAGAAYARIKASFEQIGCPGCGATAGTVQFSADDESTHWGIAAGAGIEYMPGSNLIFRAEYLYLDVATKSFNVRCVTDCITGATNFQFSSGANAHLARVGLSYKFN
jgi:outer membrane immunogenic protein